MTVVFRHQTIRLSRGKRGSPDEGACVLELASMLAGEKFSDEPVSVCPVIASLLREHNDSIEDDRRQDLYVYAAKVVGSRSAGQVQDERGARLSEWDSGGSARAGNRTSRGCGGRRSGR